MAYVSTRLFADPEKYRPCRPVAANVHFSEIDDRNFAGWSETVLAIMVYENKEYKKEGERDFKHATFLSQEEVNKALPVFVEKASPDVRIAVLRDAVHGLTQAEMMRFMIEVFSSPKAEGWGDDAEKSSPLALAQ